MVAGRALGQVACDDPMVDTCLDTFHEIVTHKRIDHVSQRLRQEETGETGVGALPSVWR